MASNFGSSVLEEPTVEKHAVSREDVVEAYRNAFKVSPSVDPDSSDTPGIRKAAELYLAWHAIQSALANGDPEKEAMLHLDGFMLPIDGGCTDDAYLNRVTRDLDRMETAEIIGEKVKEKIKEIKDGISKL